MTTPAGWYDDGSGRQRWWDGEQWTEHFAPVVDAPDTAEDTVDASTPSEDSSGSAAAATAETQDAIQSVAAVEAGATWDAPASANGPEFPDQPGSADVSGTAEAAAPDETPTQASAPAPVPPYADAAPEAPAYPAPEYPGAAPTYPGTGSAYPGATQGYGGSPYPGAAPAYGAPGAYPVAAPTTPSTPAGPSMLGLIGLGLAVLGTILACIPLTWIALLGWLMLAAGLITSVISLFRPGRKWPGITGLIVSIVGGIAAAIITVIVGIFAAVATVSDEIRDLPTAPPSSDSDTGATPPPSLDPGDAAGQVEEGTIGDTVTLRFLGGSGEVIVTDATWSADDGSGLPSTNGGFLTLETTWTGTDGVTPANPLFTSLETADGTEGQLDFATTGAPNELLDPGETASGPIAFDIVESESYVFVVTDETASEIARITITPTAG